MRDEASGSREGSLVRPRDSGCLERESREGWEGRSSERPPQAGQVTAAPHRGGYQSRRRRCRSRRRQLLGAQGHAGQWPPIFRMRYPLTAGPR